MIKRILILLVALAVHILTPHWFLKDFLLIGDWLMIFFGLLSLIIYRLIGNDKKVFRLSLLMSLSVFVYFIISAQLLSSEVGIDKIVYRLPLIFNFTFDLPNSLGKLIEISNAAQIPINTIIGILLIKRFYDIKLKRVNY